MSARTALLTGLLALGVQQAKAQAVVLELYTSEAPSDEDRPTGIAVEYLAREFTTLGQVRLGFAVRASTDSESNSFLGAGLAADLPLGEVWFLEGAIVPGYYEAGSRSFDLGSEFEIHSQIGIGRTIAPNFSLSVAFSHISNANTGDTNPGRNSVGLRLRHSF